MTLKISANVQPLEAYKVYIDGEFIKKVRGVKPVSFELTNSKHTIQLKSWNGSSSIIEISGVKKGQLVELKFETDWLKTTKEGYFRLENKSVW